MHRQYIRKRDGRPVDVMVAEVYTLEDGDEILQFGWSLHSHRNSWNKEYGLDVAKARLTACTIDYFESSPNEWLELPQSVKYKVDDFLYRVRRIEEKRKEREYAQA